MFANIVVGDEINRASPKTQSALLECMEERQVTVDGTSYPLEPPFMVIATQNPIEMEGTYPLPEAQRDRFTARIFMGYPSAEAELAMLDLHGSTSPLDSLEPVASAADVRDLIAAVRRVHVADALKQYVDQPGQRDQVRPGPAARRLAAGDAAPAPGQPGPGGPGRPRLRDPRRRAGAGRPGARAPAAADGRGDGGAPATRTRWWPGIVERLPLPAADR